MFRRDDSTHADFPCNSQTLRLWLDDSGASSKTEILLRMIEYIYAADYSYRLMFAYEAEETASFFVNTVITPSSINAANMNGVRINRELNGAIFTGTSYISIPNDLIRRDQHISLLFRLTPLTNARTVRGKKFKRHKSARISENNECLNITADGYYKRNKWMFMYNDYFEGTTVDVELNKMQPFTLMYPSCLLYTSPSPRDQA
eukprot:TRINITY_DN27638_c0_g1_i1.p1 TRINITY_DN27638_c0_g1~~TRINITY_DN27638_c0_g1_i1.p1  ORF type:complete len:203 (+),score=14.69 TRINITY_DN27638_c0_g1_i1:357-965(+)